MTAFPSGDLWARVLEATLRARTSGHLRPIETVSHVVPDAGVDFLVRVVSSLAEKPQAAPSGVAKNPFLPYEPQLFVADVSATHVALLNKYMVVDHHLLIVTRQFQDQESPLSLVDFQALARCLFEYDSVGFYNSGKLAGASQPHRHLQLVPLPLDARLAQLPIESLLNVAHVNADQVLSADRVPFAHHAWKFSSPSTSTADIFAIACQRAYRELITASGWSDVSPSTPYNLTVTRRWMMFVPRRAETFDGISLNALAFVGALLVTHESQFAKLTATGPMAALVAAAGEHH